MRKIIILCLVLLSTVARSQVTVMQPYGNTIDLNSVYEPIIPGTYIAKYYFNGFKKFVLNSTDSVTEGTTNLYFTTARAIAAVPAWLTTGNSLYNRSKFIGSSDTSQFRIRTNNVDRLIIDSLGNIAINGVPTPSAVEVLQVNGTATATYGRFTGGATAGLAGGGLEIGYTGSQGYINAQNRTTTTGNQLNINTLNNGLVNIGNVLYAPLVSGGAGKFTGSVGSITAGVGLELGNYSGMGYIGAHDRTANSAMNLTMMGLGGRVSIGTLNAPVASALLDLESTTKGFLAPQMTTTQMSAIATPAQGLIVYNTTDSANYEYSGTIWYPMRSTSKAASFGWSKAGNAGTTTSNFLGTTDAQNLVFKSNNNIGAYINTLGKVSIDSMAFGRGGAKGYNYGSIAIGDSVLATNTTGAQNTIVGDSAAIANTTGSNNVAFGYQGLMRNTTGYSNTSIGTVTLQTNTTGYNNIAVGQQALYGNTTGNNNVAIGVMALNANTSGVQNIAIGQQSLGNNSTGSYNIAQGYNALVRNTIGNYNTVNGYATMQYNTTGSSNVVNGANAGNFNTTGGNNTSIGTASLYTNSIGSGNVAVGANSLYTTTTDNQTAVGASALQKNTTGTLNTAIGYQAGFNNTTGVSNTSLGYQAMYTDTTTGYNTAVGTQALFSNVGSNNTSTGYKSLFANTTAGLSSAVGYQSLMSNTTGNYNTAIGAQSMQTNTTGNSNTALGQMSLYLNTTGNSNTATGIYSLYANTTGGNNTSSGQQSMSTNTTGSYNTVSGYSALNSNTVGSSNVSTGYNSLYNTNATVTAGIFIVGQSYTIKAIGTTDFTLLGASANTVGVVFTTTGVGVGTGTAQINTASSNNTALGTSAGQYIANGSTAATVVNNSVLLGANAYPLADNQINQIVVGYQAIGLGSNTAVFGNPSIATTQLQGNVGVGTSSPAGILDLISTTRGFLAPRMTSTQMNAIATPSIGLIIFNITDSSTYEYSGTTWYPMRTSSKASSTGWGRLGNAGTVYGTNFLGTTDNQSLRFRTNNIERLVIDSLGAINEKSTNNTVNLLNNTGVATTTDRAISIGNSSVSGIASIGIGVGGTVSGTGSVAIGYTASSSGGIAISLGGLPATSTGGIAIGGNTASSGGVSIGGGTKTSNGANLAAGSGANATAQGAIAIGTNPLASAARSIAIGDQDTTSNAYSISMGFAARSTASNQFVIGGYNVSAGNGYSITDMYLGSGVVGDGYNTKSGDNASINASGSFGTNQTGGSLTLAGGKGTGTGLGGDVILSTTATGVTGATLQTLAPRWYVKAATGQLSNGSTPNASALVDIQSTTQGLLLPRLTTTQKNAIASPATGLIVYDSTYRAISTYNGTAWVSASPTTVGTATLAAGTVTVSAVGVLATSKIFVSVTTPGGTQGFLSVPTANIIAGTSFVINSTSTTETSTINYSIVN